MPAEPILRAAERVQLLWRSQPESVYADGDWAPAPVPPWPEGWFTEHF